MKKYVLTLIVLVIVSIVSCTKENSALKTARLKIGGWTISAEVADTPQTRETGLMNRRSLNDDCGMIFVYDRDQKLSFWMKNTTIPLSIAYIASDGTIKEIYDMEPLSRKTVDSEHSVRYALEVNRGYFEKNGVKPGDRVEWLP